MKFRNGRKGYGRVNDDRKGVVARALLMLTRQQIRNFPRGRSFEQTAHPGIETFPTQSKTSNTPKGGTIGGGDTTS